jgi:hypothetical protein
MLEEAYGQVAKKRPWVYEWHKRSHDDLASTNGNPCCGQPSPSVSDKNIKHAHSVLPSDRRKSIKEIIAYDIR